MSIQLKGAVLGVALVIASPSWADDVPAPAAEAKTETVWVADFDKAVEQAKAEKKDLFIDFTGSDWCGWCIKLHEEVFSHDDFLAAAKKDYVLVALDFPRSEEVKAKVPNPARNQELAEKYGVRGYPTILLVTPEGEVFGRTGYQPGGSAKYVEHMSKLRTDGLPALNSAKAILAEIAAAKDGDKAAAYDKAITALGALEPGAATADMLAAPVKAAFDSDADNKAGVRLKAAKALLKTGTADEAVLAASSALDPKNEQGLLERVIMAKTDRLRSLDDVKAVVKDIDDLFAAGGAKDKEVSKALCVRCMVFNEQHLKDHEKAKTYAEKVRAAGYVDGEERLKQFVDKLLGEGAAPAPAPKSDK